MANSNELDKTFSGLSKLFLEFNIDFDGFCKDFRNYHVLAAYKVCKTITRTALRVGLGRRVVSAIINDAAQYRRVSSLLTILNEIENLAKYSDMIINKRGDHSVLSIINKVARGATTLNSVIDELCALGCIEDLGSSVKFLNKLDHNHSYRQEGLQKFSSHLDMFINELIDSLHGDDIKS